jgi:Dicarboxylate transport
MSRAVKRLLAFLSGTLAALLLLAAALWWWAAPSLAEWALGRALRGADLPPIAFRVESVAWNRLALRDIRLGAGEVVAQGAELGFGWDDFVAGRAGSAIVRGLRVSARRSESGWSLGSLDPWLARVLASRGGSRAAAPLRRLAIEDGAIAIDTPAGSAHANLTADLGLGSPLTGEVALDWQLPDAATGNARGALDAAGAIRARAELALDRAQVALFAPALAERWPGRVAATLEATGARAGDALELEVALDAQLADARAPSRIRRATGPVRLRWQPDALLVRFAPCLNVALPAGPVFPGIALERAGAICVRTDESAPIRVNLDGGGARLAAARVVATAADLPVLVSARHRRVRGRDVVLEIATDPAAPTSRGTLRLTGARFDLPDAALALQKPLVAGDWTFASALSLAGRFDVGRLADPAPRARFPALLGGGTIALDAREVKFDARARDESGALAARIRGRHALASGAGSAELRFDPLAFGPPRSAMPVLQRWLGPRLRIEDGAIGVDAQLRWGSTTGFLASANLSADGAAIRASRNRIDGIAGTVALAEVFPPTTRGVQEMRFRSANVGIPFGAGYVRYALERGHVVRIADAGSEFAGGRIDVRGALDLDGGPEQRLEISLVNLRAPALLALAPVDGLEVSGTLNGQLVLTVEDGRPVLRGGTVRAIDGGQIRYRPSGDAAIPATAPSDVASVLRDVLRDFRYELLDVSATGWLDERAEVQCKLRGYNPSFQNGRPVDLTVNLSSKFAEVIEAIPALQSFFAKLAESPRANTGDVSPPSP